MTPEDKIDELEAALTANDEYLQKMQAHNAELLKGGIELQARYEVIKELNAELLAVLKGVGDSFVNGRRVFDGIPLEVRKQAEAAISKEEERE